MSTRVSTFNRFLFFKLPAAWWTGVRLKALDAAHCEVGVRYRWINQNPFRSMFWAVQGMAAELTTGALVMDKIRARGGGVSMLVTHMEADFTKKATGKITFRCEDGLAIDQVLDEVFNGPEPRNIVLHSVGTDEAGDEVARFQFHWSMKKRSPKV